MRKLALLLVFALFSAIISAQQIRTTNGSPRIMEVNEFLTSLRNSEQNQRTTNSAFLKLQRLLKDVQPAIYFTSNSINTYGENPTALYTDVISLNSINSSNISRNQIEIVTIKINSDSDLNGFINLSVFSNFPNLKYIYILSNIETTENAIVQIVQNSNPSLSVFYKIDKGS